MPNLERRSILVADSPRRHEPRSASPQCPCCQLAALDAPEEYIQNNLELLEPIGAGGFCEIFRAKYYGVLVAVKCPKPDESVSFGGGNSEADVLFTIHEARILKSLGHPNIIKVYSYTVNPPQIVMEYHRRGSLANLIRQQPHLLQDPKLRLKLSLDISTAMWYFHHSGRLLCHGDLTTSNVLISESFEAVVCDAGLAKYVQTCDCTQEEPPEPPGRNFTRQAPEVILGRTFGEESDVYSMSMVMYEMLTGRPPFGRDAVEFPHRLHSQIAREGRKPELPADLTQLPGWHPILMDYVTLMKRCWSTYLNDRPSFAQLKEELAELLHRYEQEVSLQDGVQLSHTKSVTRQTFTSSACVLALGVLFSDMLTPYLTPSSVTSQETYSRFIQVLPYGLLAAGIVAVVWYVFDKLYSSGRFRNARSQSDEVLDGRDSQLDHRPIVVAHDISGDDRAMVDRSPFEYARPDSFYASARLDNDSTVRNYPVPNAEIMSQLRNGIFCDLVHRPEEPWRYELARLCSGNFQGCPTQEEWHMFEQFFIDYPAARALPTWVRYEQAYNRASITGADTDASGVPIAADEGPSNRFGIEIQPVYYDFQGQEQNFFTRRAPGEEDSEDDDSGLSCASTGALTIGEWI